MAKINPAFLFGWILMAAFLPSAGTLSADCTPQSATLTLSPDDISNVWINGNFIGTFNFVGGGPCGNAPTSISVNPAFLNASGINYVSVVDQNQIPSQVFMSWLLDITCQDGSHTYVSSGDNLGSMQFYNTPSNCSATQPPGSGGNGNWWDPAWIPSGWGSPVVDTGVNLTACITDPRTGLTVPRLSYSSDGTSSDSCQYLWFRQGFTATYMSPTVSPTPSCSPTAVPPGCGNPSFVGGQVLQAGMMGMNSLFNTYSYTVPSLTLNSLVMVEIEEQSSATAISSMTFGGAPLTLWNSNGSANGGGNLMIYYLTASALAAGATNLVINFGSLTNNGQWVVQVQVCGGVNQSTPLGANTLTSQSTPSFTDSITTVANNSLLVDFLDNGQNSFPNAWGPGQFSTGIAGATAGYGAWSDYKAVAAAGGQSMSYTGLPSGQSLESWLVEIEGGAACGTPTYSATGTGTVPATPTATYTPTRTFTPTSTITLTATPTFTPNRTRTPSPTASITFTATNSPTYTCSLTPTPTPSITYTATATSTYTPTQTNSPTASITYTASITPTPTPTRTNTPTSSITYTSTATPTYTPTPTNSPTASITYTASITPTSTPTRTNSPTSSITFTLTNSATLTGTPTWTPTASVTLTYTFTRTITFTPSITVTFSPSPTFSFSPTITPTLVAMPYMIGIWVYNTAGEIVRHLYSGQSTLPPSAITLSAPVVGAGTGSVKLNLGSTLSSGSNFVAWDGRNDQGQFVSSGQYYFQIQDKDTFARVTIYTQPVAVMGVYGQNTVFIFNSAGELVFTLAVSLPNGANINAITLDQDTFAPAFDPATGKALSHLTVTVTDNHGNTYPYIWNGLTSQGRPAESGIYTVCGYSSESNNSFTRSLTILKANTVPGDTGARLAPNPVRADGRFRVSYHCAGGYRGQATVFNLAGEAVLKSGDPGCVGIISLDASALASGIYIVKFELTNGFSVYYRQRLKLAILK